MIVRKTIAAAVVVVAALTAIPANAGVSIGLDFGGPGVYWNMHDKMTPREVRRMLRHRGYHDIDFVDRHGAMYKLTARKHGDEFYIVVNAWSGDIVHRHEI